MSLSPERTAFVSDASPIGGDEYEMSARPAAVCRTHTIPRKAISRPISIRQFSTFSDETFKRPYEILPESELQGEIPQYPPQYSYYGGHVWLPGWWNRFPHRGFAALLACFLCIMGSIIVLIKSDGQEVSRWQSSAKSLTPAVILSILVTALNIFARLAYREGVKVSWWYKALRGGTVEDLHNHWTFTDNFWRALFAGRKFNLITLSSIAITILVIDQPLIQRATTTVSAVMESKVNVTFEIAPEVPWGFSGYRDDTNLALSQVMTEPMILVFNNVDAQNNPYINTWGCKGTCTGFLQAGGVSARCNSTTGPMTYHFDDLLLKGGSISDSPFSVSFFLIDATPKVGSQIKMQVAYTNSSNSTTCSGLRTEVDCYLAPATLRYPVTLYAGENATNPGSVAPLFQADNLTTVSFQPPPLNSDGNLVADSQLGDSYTLGGISVAINSLFASNATYTVHQSSRNDWSYTDVISSLYDLTSNQYLDIVRQNYAELRNSSELIHPSGCGLNWNDPTSNIIASINAMMFHLSITAANIPYRNTSSPLPHQNVTMSQEYNTTIYRSNHKYLIAYLVLTFVFLILILPTYDGWHHLGRGLSMNPIETAKAFDAPILQGPGSNATLEQLIEIYGRQPIKYGEVDRFEENLVVKQLKMADPSVAARPNGITHYV